MNSGFRRAQAATTRLLTNLRRRFLATRRLRTRDNLTPLREAGRQIEWVVSRGWCLFLLVDCGTVPRKRRADFVATAVRRASPFPAPGWRIAWHGDRAMVWIWPQDQLTDPGSQPAVAQSAAPQRFVPETLLRGAPLADGVQLVRCSDGVEARAWVDGCLHANNWWPDVPDASAWATFCRGAGFAPQALPAVVELPWREEPWTVTRDLSLNQALLQSQRLAIPAACALVVLAAAYQAGALVRLELARHAVASEIARESARVSDILTQRNHAEDDLAAIHALLALRPPVPQVELMERVGQLLDKQQAHIVRWSMPDPQTLDVTISMPSPNPRALVLAFQQTGLFTDIGADVGHGGENQLIIHAKVAPAQANGGSGT
jgi:hypothetical protein